MKACSTLFIAMGFVSSAVLAQSAPPAPESAPRSMPETGAATPPAGAGQMPPPTMGSETQAPATTEDSGALSSGASGAQSVTSGGSGQLITPEIAQSSPAVESTGIGVEPKTENGVTYLCGGVGQNESTYMQKVAAKDYDLMMTFAEKSGSYVADVDVSIKDARGKTVLETKCDAPILLVDLPSGGNYRIHADASGKALDRSATVKAGKGNARQLRFVWPNSAVAASKASEAAGRESSGSDSDESESSGDQSYGTESSGGSGSESYGTESSGSEGGSERYPGDGMR